MNWIMAKNCLNDLTSRRIIQGVRQGVGQGVRSFRQWRRAPLISGGGVLLLSLLVFGGCPWSSQEPSKSVVSGPSEILLKKGRTVYQTQCAICHNADPRKSGTLGPEVFGASRELLEARIMRAEYPPGYVPKRTTHTMAPLKHLKEDLEAIHFYLNHE